MEPPNLFYRGSSMRGTFKPGDKLIIEKIPFKKIRKGDLVIFSKTGVDKNDFVVHRVVRMTSAGLTTRGDNCREADQDPVTEEIYVGRVVEYDRNGSCRKARNGAMGVFQARKIRMRLFMIRALKKVLRKPYRTLRGSGIVMRLWRPELEKIRFDTPEGALIKLIHQGRTIATIWVNKKKTSFVRPYDLVIRSGWEGKEFLDNKGAKN